MGPSCIVTMWMPCSLQMYNEEAIMYGHNMDAPFFTGVQGWGHHVWSQYGCSILYRCARMRPSCMVTIWMQHSLQVYKDEAIMYGHDMDAPFLACVQRCGHDVWSQYGCIALCRCTKMWSTCMVTIWMHRCLQVYNDVAILYGHRMDASWLSAVLQWHHPAWPQYGCIIFLSIAEM